MRPPVRARKAMSRFTTLLWDVDDTLLDFSYSQRHALTQCFRSIGREITEGQIKQYSRINEDFWKRLELGEITKAQLLPGRFAVFFRELGIEGVDMDAFLRQYQRELGSVFSFHDDSLEICRTLQGKVKQYVVTNGVAVTQRSKLELSGLAAYMDGMFISEEIGHPKPDIRFFHYCLSHMEEKDKSRILVVGDSLTSDVKGGIQARLPVCWYNRGGSGLEAACGFRPDYEINDLHMIFGILED